MNYNDVLKDLNTIFKEVFDNNDIVVADSTTAHDVDEWDSLTHIELVVAIEKHFNLRFTSADIESWATVGDMARDIEKRTS